jgi:hypothetical protein
MIVIAYIVRAENIQTFGVLNKRSRMKLDLFLLAAKTTQITAETDYEVVDQILG